MGIEKVKREPTPEVVKLLSRLLLRAESGELLSVAVAYVDDSVSLASYNYWARGKDRLVLVGVLDLCKDDVKSGVAIHRNSD